MQLIFGIQFMLWNSSDSVRTCIEHYLVGWHPGGRMTPRFRSGSDPLLKVLLASPPPTVEAFTDSQSLPLDVNQAVYCVY